MTYPALPHSGSEQIQDHPDGGQQRASNASSRRSTRDHVAYPTLAPLGSGQQQRSSNASSRRSTRDHAAYPTIAPPEERKPPRTGTAEQQMEEGSFGGLAPYPSVAPPVEKHQAYRPSADHNDRRVSWQSGNPEPDPSDARGKGQRSRRTTADGGVRHGVGFGSARVSDSGQAAEQHAAPMADAHGRRGTDASVTVSYPDTGKSAASSQECLCAATCCLNSVRQWHEHCYQRW